MSENYAEDPEEEVEAPKPGPKVVIMEMEEEKKRIVENPYAENPGLVFHHHNSPSVADLFLISRETNAYIDSEQVIISGRYFPYPLHIALANPKLNRDVSPNQISHFFVEIR